MTMPPPQNLRRYYTRWLWYAPIGFCLFGFGLCLFNEVGAWKHAGASLGVWVSWGTLSLVLINAGLAFVGDAVKNRALYEWHKQQSQS